MFCYALKNKLCKSLRKSKPSVVGAMWLPVRLIKPLACAVSSAACMRLTDKPVRSVYRLSSKPLRKRSALSMNSKLSSSSATSVLDDKALPCMAACM